MRKICARFSPNAQYMCKICARLYLCPQCAIYAQDLRKIVSISQCAIHAQNCTYFPNAQYMCKIVLISTMGNIYARFAQDCTYSPMRIICTRFAQDCTSLLKVLYTHKIAGIIRRIIINSCQKDVEVFCVALVTYKLTNLIIRRFGLSPKRRIIKFFFKFTYFALGSLFS